jgi:glycosyltransferase involved in cell wall biosynthesis
MGAAADAPAPPAAPPRVAAGRAALSALAFHPGHRGGLNRYAAELLPRLADRWGDALLYAPAAAARDALGPRARAAGGEAMARPGGAGNLLRMAWTQLFLPPRLRRDRAAVFFSPLPEGTSAPPCPQVVTVHDLIPLRVPGAGPRLARYYRHLLPRVLRASAAVVCVSRTTADHVREAYGLDGVPVHVVHQGVRAGVFRPRDPARAAETARGLGLGLGEYVLVLGESRAYKNLGGVLRAFARVREAGLTLAVAGRVGDDAPRLAASLGIAPRVRFLGGVDDETLADLYAAARAFVFPSFHEGFGIPPLEAMACGCPVVASRAASIPEVCGDGALYVDPADGEEIADALARVATDDTLRGEMRGRGLARAAGFSYDAAADAVAAVLAGVAR